MGGIMRERDRSAAWDALKSACKQYLEVQSGFDVSMNAAEEVSVRRALRDARDRIIDVWQRFPECWGDGQGGNVPPAEEILASIKRQEQAIEWAKKLQG